jgi:nucleoporin SEH1
MHDMKYDYYGKRIVTCSSDDTIKVWDVNTDGEYKAVASWKAHNGSIWKVEWAYPGFGQIIASCSFDRSVSIWEETRENEWTRKQTLLEATKSVLDIKFAPSHIGLMLASLSADGRIRIYEAPDPMNPTQWNLIQDFVCKGGTCLTWDPSRFNIATIAIGCDEGSIKLFQYKENYKTWENIKSTKPTSFPIHDIAWAPPCGRSYSLFATGSKDGSVTLYKLHKTIEIIEKFEKEMNEVWKVDWNVTGNILACSDDMGQIRLVKYINSKWKMEKIEKN